MVGIFPDWFGVDRVQTSILVFGFLLIVLGVFCEIKATIKASPVDTQTINQFFFDFSTNQPGGTTVPDRVSSAGPQASGNSSLQYFLYKVGALVLISVGTSIMAAGIILRITRQMSKFQDSLEKSGVLFVGDREAFDEVIGWPSL